MLIQRQYRPALVAILVAVMCTALLPIATVAAREPASSPGVRGPFVGPKVTPKISLPARELPPAPAPSQREVDSLLGTAEVVSRGNTGIVDPVAQLSESDTRSLEQLGDPIVNVLGQGGANPNDTTGDVGPNDFVQAINVTFQIFDKQGNPRTTPALLNSFWTSAGDTTSACGSQNNGDPIVLYDNMADRWLISQMAQTQFICVAISQTADPTGVYYLYQFAFARFPDYFKIGAWPDGYYVSANLNGPNEALAAVMDRANMLNGNPAGTVEFAAPTLVDNFDMLLPSDLDGNTPPPAGTPNFMYRQVDADIIGGAFDRIELWEFHVNWANPAASTFTGPTDIPTAPFDSDTCGYGFVQCPEQPGTTQRLDPIQIASMYRFPYRNFGSKEVMLGNFTVDADGNDGVGIRWFVLERSGGGAWSVANEGTYAPQPGGAQPWIYRWMGSVAMDRFGNIALGHTASSSQNIFPSARYTGRKAGDPLGLMPQPEKTILAGVSATTGNRWGDYYTMVVDPVDDCTFWYTGDATGASGVRQSVIASFRFDDCATDLAISKSVSPSDPNAGEEAIYTITVTNNGPLDAANVVVTDELPAEVSYLADTDTCSGVAVGSTGTLTCELGNLAAGASTSFEIKVKIDPDLGGATSITNTASVSSDAGESNPANNTVSLTHLVNELADLAVTKLCKPDSDPAQAGSEGVCTILVTNHGPSAARDVELTDTHVSDGAFSITGVTTTHGSCTDADGVVDCALGKIQPAATAQIDVSITSPDGVDVNDVAQVTSATPDPVSANNQASAGLSFSASANLSITKSGPTEVDFLDSFSYTLEVTNAGPSTATNVVVSDTLPAGVEYVSSMPSVGTVNVVGNVLTWSVGNLAALASASLDINVKVLPSAPATLLNNASVTSSTADPNTSDNQATWTTTVNGTDLWLDKQANVSAQNPSGALVYLITVHNEPGQVADDTPTSGHGGPNPAINVVVSDPLPLTSKKMVVQFLSTGCVYDEPSHTVTCTVAELAPGTSVTFEIQFQIKGSVGSFTNTATVTSDTFDPNLANNSDTVTTVYQGGTGKGPKPK